MDTKFEMWERRATSPSLSIDSASRVSRVGEQVIATAENIRWANLLQRLATSGLGGKLSSIQTGRFLHLWDSARRTVNLLYPAVNITDDGVLELSWSYGSRRGKAFTIDVLRDGGMNWFFMDDETGFVKSSGDLPVLEIPADIWARGLAAFRRDVVAR